MTISPVLAEALPATDAHSLVVFAETCGVLITLLGAASLIVWIWSMTKKEPPADQLYASKNEVLEMDRRLSQQILTIQQDRQKSVADLHSKFDANFGSLKDTLNRGMEDLNRAIGRLEGDGNLKRDLIEVLKGHRHV